MLRGLASLLMLPQHEGYPWSVRPRGCVTGLKAQNGDQSPNQIPVPEFLSSHLSCPREGEDAGAWSKPRILVGCLSPGPQGKGWRAETQPEAGPPRVPPLQQHSLSPTFPRNGNLKICQRPPRPEILHPRQPVDNGSFSTLLFSPSQPWKLPGFPDPTAIKIKWWTW